MIEPDISVVIPTRNPNRDRLNEVLLGLEAQTLSAGRWEICVVDNGSTVPLAHSGFTVAAPMKIVREERPGLLAARLCGLTHTRSRYVVFIDDDTVPSPGFLSAAVSFMEDHPGVGTAGGKISPRYLVSPPDWLEKFAWLLALRDNGPACLEWNQKSGTPFPPWTPIGAGLLIRRPALVPGYLQHVETHAAQIERLSWQGQGAGGVEDKDLVLYSLRAGWSTGYVPEMELVHVIPEERLRLTYFEKLLPAVEKMWAQTLHAHGFESHPPIHPRTLSLRKIKAWFAFRAWRSPVNRLQWFATCGYLDGLAANYAQPFRYGAPKPA